MALGPALRWVGDQLAYGLANIYDFAGPVGGLLFGLVYAPIVITGLHQSFPPVETMLWTQGGSFIFPIAAMSNIAQGGATLAVYFLAKSDKLKGLSGASGVSALFGITEPAMFGVNLRLRWPFYIAICASAIGGALVTLFGVLATALGAAGFIGLVSIQGSSVPAYLLICVITLVVSFAGAYIYGRVLLSRNGTIDPDEIPAAADSPAQEPLVAPADNATTIASPLHGTAMNLSEVSDPMFAAGKLGSGMAVEPETGKLLSPIDGNVTVTFPSGHAYAVRGKDAEGNNVDILMHIGFDTVNLQGEHFTAHVNKGDEVKAGDLLAEFGIQAIKAAGYPVTTPVVVSNSKKLGAVLPAAVAGESVGFSEALCTVDPPVVTSTV